MNTGNLADVYPTPQFLPLERENFPKTQFSKSFITFFLLRAIYHVYHPFKMTVKITVRQKIFKSLYATRKNTSRKP